MKISVKLPDDHHHQSRREPPLLILRAKVPITIFNLPFVSHFSTTNTHPSDLSLSLSTNFASGPSLKFSYATAAGAAYVAPPFNLTLKSGTGLFGSPKNSPLVISAHFSFSDSNPKFSLHFKPQFGSFSLRKRINSPPGIQPVTPSDRANDESGSDSPSFGFVPVEIPATPVAKELSVEKSENPNSIVKGIYMAARTQMPVAKKLELNFRWWVNFAEDQMPVLRINKIGIQRVDESASDDGKKNKETDMNDLQMMKGVCFWMKREVDALTKANREMKAEFEEMKSEKLSGNNGGLEFRERAQRKPARPSPPPVESTSSGFEQWRSKRKGGSEEISNSNGIKKSEKGSGDIAIDVENELQRAIKAATAAP